MKNRDETNSLKRNLQAPGKKKIKLWKSLTIEGFHLRPDNAKTRGQFHLKRRLNFLFLCINSLNEQPAYRKLAAFIREHRSNEENFDKLYNKLEEEMVDKTAAENYVAGLQQIKEKQPKSTKKQKNPRARPGPNLKNLSANLKRP